MNKKMLEIGCGKMSENPEGGLDAVALDLDRGDLYRSVLRETPPLLQANAGHLPFPDDVFDIILARNVIGEPALGQSSGYLDTFSNRDFESALNLKLRILGEAARTLVPAGKIIVAESYTPEVAEEFFETHTTNLPSGISRPREVEFDTRLTPFASRHMSGKYRTWELTKLN